MATKPYNPFKNGPFRYSGQGAQSTYKPPVQRFSNNQDPWFSMYGPMNIPQPDPYFLRWQQNNPEPVMPPPQPTNLGTGGVPTGTIPGIPSLNPVQYGPPQAPQYAPTNTGGGTPGNPNYDYWYDLQQNQETWTPEQQAQYLAAFYGQKDEQGNLTGVGNPRWGDPYQVMPYWKYQQPTWIGGRTGGGSSMGSGRMSGRYYIPEQQVYKTPGGKPRASRDGYKDALGIPEDEEVDGDNVAPMWTGQLVNWRT